MGGEIDSKVKNVASNVRKSRKAKGKSQEQVARRLQISQNAYSKLETGKTKLTLLNLMVIADYLEIEVSELLV
ncbi:helix-turn-helix domain-containing protein [Mucilaginibacter aquaedulcis]|uniref:helix-turn-helix domain-containing protein n=1 Tax=Mucilaginibacter aquaedulcis TaxID=1187081 RepID=UPI0025B2EB97|nr:helix-turn-helix transcriptional regulator [Mucilaginibacter aquaedulcis]MDN3551239.1 helix-turn-helix transcriptional regulator [Mucilaginibacter aquaedulcis]